MYTLANYDIISQSIDFTLPHLYLDNISILHTCMGVHNLQVKPVYVDSRRGNNESTHTWKKRDNFKVTVMAKKEGCETLIGDLKTYLNKITSANYDAQLKLINDNIEELSHFYDNEEGEDKHTLGIAQAIDVIVNVACNNKYHSMLYANLYSNLVTSYPGFIDEKTRIYTKLLSSFDDIEIVDPNEDYDKFCMVNKKNDERRSHMLYVINLFKTGNYTNDQICCIVKKLHEMISLQLNDSTRVEYTNELTEIMNVFVLNMITEIKENEDWRFVKDMILEYSKYKTKDYPGLSSRTIFKYMDMVDLFK
jgi:hypothetical protein